LLLLAIRFWNKKHGDPFKKIDVTLILTTPSKVKSVLLMSPFDLNNFCLKHFFWKCLFFQIFCSL